jgi:hypothetical protein
MEHRTDGTTYNCKGCRYWSEMIAQSIGCGPVQAICLSQESERKGRYTTGRETCAQWASGHLGAIDEPGQDPLAYQKEEQARHE